MNHAVAALQQPIAEVKVGPVQVSAFADMQQLLAFIIREDGSTYAGSAIAINPEKVLTAMRNSEIEAVISGADIRYADGIGVVKVMRRRLKKNVQRIPGCELWQQLMLRQLLQLQWLLFFLQTCQTH